MIKLTSPSFRRTIAALGVASLTLLAGTPSAGASTTDAEKKPTFDTYKSWDGVSFLQPWGNPQTSNYGQTITVPNGKDSIKQFTFYMAAQAGTGTITYRAYVYGWDGTKATEEVFRSKTMQIETVQGDPEVKSVKVKTKKAKVQEGEQYVLFLSLDEEYEENTPNVTTQWALHLNDVLPGGNTVWLNSDGDEGQWTTVPWSSVTTYDMAFKASLK